MSATQSCHSPRASCMRSSVATNEWAMHDKRAREILFGAFWKDGWIRDADRCVLSPDDFAYAKRMGYMFDPIELSHDQVVSQLVEECERADVMALSNSFLASLG